MIKTDVKYDINSPKHPVKYVTNAEKDIMLYIYILICKCFVQ